MWFLIIIFVELKSKGQFFNRDLSTLLNLDNTRFCNMIYIAQSNLYNPIVVSDGL